MVEAFIESGAALWQVLGDMAPYLLLGFLVAGALSVVVSPEVVERHLGGRGMGPVVKASLFGVPLPLCSCGVVPVAASLRRHGASRGATAAFMLSTPQTGVDSIMVTLSLLGPVFAIFRPLAALVTGVVGGGLVSLLPAEPRESAASGCTDPCCAPDSGAGPVRRALRYGFVTLPGDIGRPMLVGLVVAGVLAAFVSDDLLAGLFGGGVLAMVVAAAAGIPVYVCATASVPVAAALIAKGASPGVALVFLMTGPATNAAAIATLWHTLGRRATVVYLASLAVCAVGLGLGLDALMATAPTEACHGMHQFVPVAVKNVCAVALLAVLIHGMAPRSAGSEQPQPGTTVLQVQGMTCSHCAESVRRALLACAGVQTADVDPRSGRAEVTGDGLDLDALRQAVTAAGYTVS